MTEDLKTPLYITIGNTGDKASFIPYRENLNFILNNGENISFICNDSEAAIYYKNQATKDLKVNIIDSTNYIKIDCGDYNSSTNTFTSGASFNTILVSEESNTFKYDIVGKLPYKSADATLGLAEGNIFTAVLKNPNITSKSDLPSGKIAKISNSKASGGFNEYTKSAFEDDGSLIIVTEIPVNSKKIIAKITWVEDVETTYEFDLSKGVLLSQGENASNINSYNISESANITIYNNNKVATGFVIYKESIVEYIQPNDSLVLTTQKPEEAMYYLAQNNNILKVSI